MREPHPRGDRARTQRPTDEGWSSDDAVLLTAADELDRDSRISDKTWAVLAARYVVLIGARP